MNRYLRIQQKRFGRLLKSSGVHPIAAILFISACFVALSYFVLSSYEYANYLYPTIAIFLTISLSKATRLQFLESCFSRKTYSKIRVVENIFVILPFIIFLTFYSHFMSAFALLVIGLLLSKVKIKTSINWVLPTPYSKKPFEFIVGFRKTFLLFIGTYILTFISISVDNYNLGIFSLGIQFLIVSMFYLNQSEPNLYVWIHSMTPGKFIQNKLKIALIQSLILSAPILISLIIVYPIYYLITTAILILGLLYLVTAVLFKYAYYPKLSIVQEMGYLICLLTPPIIIIVIPLLYIRTKQNLNTILND